MPQHDVIKQILDISSNINLEFRTSKMPLFIRKFKANKDRKKLRKSIINIQDIILQNPSILVEFEKYVSLKYPPFGKYKNVERVASIDIEADKYTSCICVKLDTPGDYDYCFAYIANNIDDYKITIRYVYQSMKQNILSFIEQVDCIKRSEVKYNTNYLTMSVEDKHYLMRDAIADAIVKVVGEFLNERLDIDERAIKDE